MGSRLLADSNSKNSRSQLAGGCWIEIRQIRKTEIPSLKSGLSGLDPTTTDMLTA